MFRKIKSIIIDKQVVPIRRYLLLKYCPQHQITYDVWDGNHFNSNDLMILEVCRDKIFGDNLKAYPNQIDAGFSMLNGAPLRMGHITSMIEANNKFVVAKTGGNINEAAIQVQTGYYDWFKTGVVTFLLGLLLFLISLNRSTYHFNALINTGSALMAGNQLQDAYKCLDEATALKKQGFLASILNSDEKMRARMNRQYIKNTYQLAMQNTTSQGTPYSFMPWLAYNPDSIVLRYLYQHPIKLKEAAETLFDPALSKAVALEKMKRLQEGLRLQQVANSKVDSCDLKQLVKNTQARFEFYRDLLLLKHQIKLGVDISTDVRKMTGVIEKGMENEFPDLRLYRNEFIALLLQLQRTGLARCRPCLKGQSGEKLQVLLTKLKNL